MRNPESSWCWTKPTNDLDIQTLQVLEEYLQDFAGCVIVVSHDRYFMDKVVDRSAGFQGRRRNSGFPRQLYAVQGMEPDAGEGRGRTGETGKERKCNGRKRRKQARQSATPTLRTKRKMSYKEKREYEQLTQEIDVLTEEQKKLEEELCSGNLSVEELTEKSKRLPEIKDELDEKEMRWLELAEML